jgi:hypothetical protein
VPNSQRKERVPKSLFTALLFAFTAMVFALESTYRGNIESFSVSLPSIYAFLSPFFACASLALFLVLVFLPQGISRRLIAVTLSLVFLLYLQGNFFVWDYGLFDGSDIEWEKFQRIAIIEILIWSAVLIAALLRSEFLYRRFYLCAGALAFVQIAGIAADSFSVEALWEEKSEFKSDLDLYNFSSERNVVMVVLDAFQSTAFERIIESTPEYTQTFSGFTFFNDAMANFKTTKMAIPALLTGAVYDNTYPVWKYFKESVRGKTLPDVLARSGFRSHVVTYGWYCGYFLDSLCTHPMEQLEGDARRVRRMESTRLADLALFRYLPDIAKRKIYNDHTWLLWSRLIESPETRNNNRDQRYAIELIDNFERFSTVDQGPPRFKFIHFILPHEPLTLGADCVRRKGRISNNDAGHYLTQAECAVRLSTRLIEQMKKLGVYDNSVIAIIGDHGMGVGIRFSDAEGPETLKNVERAFPLMLVKRAYDSGAMKTASVPVSLNDLPRTISDLLGVESDFEGESVFDLNPEIERERRYYDYTWTHRYWHGKYMPTTQEYIVKGSARRTESWKLGRLLPDLDEEKILNQ